MPPRPNVRNTAGHGSTAQKRPGDRLDDRGAKRRSSRACLGCRARKVRCDVLNGGVPCTNCRLDSVECVLKESTRGRKRKPDRGFNESRSFGDTQDSHAGPNTPDRRPGVGVPVASSPSATPGPGLQQQLTPPNTDLVSLTFEDGNSRAQPMEPANGSHKEPDHHLHVAQAQHPQQPLHQHQPAPRLDTTEQLVVSSCVPQRAAQSSHGSHGSHVGQMSPPNSNYNNHDPFIHGAPNNPPIHTPANLPPYIKPLPSRLNQWDIDYLAKKDAFTIPDDQFRDELLRTYARIIHPFMPAIELPRLLLPVIRADNHASISLLLFQAVMFASVIFVDPDLLQSRGYSSRKAARKAFFNRVRLLYALDCEPDRLALVQSLLLMTYWYDSPADEKDTWHWMGITLSLSQVLGLHRDPETLNISLEQKRLRRRIWWSVYIRDRLLALGIRRSVRIRSDDFCVPMLELDDFDLGQLPSDFTAFIGPCCYATSEADGHRVMHQISVELAELCVCIGEILHSQYSVIGDKPINYEAYKNIAVLPRNVHRQMSELVRCDNMLKNWHRKQKQSCRYSPPSPRTTASSSNHDHWAEKITWLHQALLRMIYLTAVGALHRPRALMTQSSSSAVAGSSDVNDARRGSMTEVKEAAISMTKLAFDLHSQNYLRFLSTSSVPAFLSAIFIHILDLRNGDEQLRNLAVGRFYQCFHALYELQDMYSSADYAIRFLASILKGMDLHIPMLGSLASYANSMLADTHTSTKSHTHSTSDFGNYEIPPNVSAYDTPEITNQSSMSPPIQTHAPVVNQDIGLPELNTDLFLPNLEAPIYADFGVRTDEFTMALSNNQISDPSSDQQLWSGIDALLPSLISMD